MSDENSPPDELVLEITRPFRASRGRVFEAWTKQEWLDRWSAPAGFTIPYAEGDARPGGAWKMTMVAPDGEEYRLGGVYRAVEPEERLVFTHVWEEDDGPGHETTVTVQLAEENGQTEMRFRQATFKSKESRDSHREGWSECFDKLDELLAAAEPAKP